jgi:predicted acylesterase/phospholipase RssA
MPAFAPTRRKFAALLLAGSTLGAAPALAAAPSGKKAHPPARKPAAPAGPPPRQSFSADDQRLAQVPGFPDARFFGDSDHEFLEVTRTANGPWLSISGGGEDGAFGAGLLAGMSSAGTRPEFALVSGVSTGALMAPYVFLGSAYDEALRHNYTSIHSGDIFELAATPESLLDTWPLKKTIEKAVTPAMLAAIAVEHAKGRRLLVISTNLDAGRPVVWDMGAIATRGGDAAVALFRDILLASSSIPGFFPPVHIAVEANGKKFSEMHADGTIRTPFYVAPEGVLAGGAPLAAKQLYVLVNNKLTTDFQLTERSMTGVLARSITVALKLGLRGEVLRIGAAAQRAGIGLEVAVVPPSFDHQARGMFDPEYMQALFALGVQQGRRGAGFGKDVYAAVGATRPVGG